MSSAAAYPAGAHRPPTTRRALRTWVWFGLALTGFAVLGLVSAAYFGQAFGARVALTALLVAALPLGLVLPTFLWLDRFEAEPTRYLVIAFLWGALVAAAGAAIVNSVALAFLRGVVGKADAELVTAVGVAPIVEEGLKGLVVLLVLWFARREFDGVVDGMVYAGIAATGFAFTENIQYLATAYSDFGAEGLTGVFVLRGIMSPFAHPMFTILTGIGVGIAATTRSGWLKVLAPLGGYLLAVLAHALWNLAAMTSGAGLLVVYLLVEVPIFLGFLAMVFAIRRREGRLIGRYLLPYADAGWLAPAEVAMLSSMAKRREARAWAKTNAGRPGLRAMEDFQDNASELALLRRRMGVLAPTPGDLATERDLLVDLVRRRRRFLGQAS